MEKEARNKGKGPAVGRVWHKNLEKAIDNPSSDNNEEAKDVIKALKSAEMSVVSGIEFLQTEFPLYGFMKDKESLETYFWHGNVDAIGWFEGKHVIVEWKTADLLDFWEKNTLAYGDYLHQGLVYGRLLQLQLKLEDLPYILLVPIDNFSGKSIHPALFRNFPEECTKHLTRFEWSLEKKQKDEITVDKNIIKEMEFPKNLDDVKIKDLFKDDTTVRQLLDGFGLKSFTLKND